MIIMRQFNIKNKQARIEGVRIICEFCLKLRAEQKYLSNLVIYSAILLEKIYTIIFSDILH